MNMCRYFMTIPCGRASTVRTPDVARSQSSDQLSGLGTGNFALRTQILSGLRTDICRDNQGSCPSRRLRGDGSSADYYSSIPYDCEPFRLISATSRVHSSIIIHPTQYHDQWAELVNSHTSNIEYRVSAQSDTLYH